MSSDFKRNDTEAGEAPAIVAPTSIGRFKIIRSVGTGGMGDVFLAEDPQSGGTVAIKRADLSAQARLKSEAEALSKVQHPNVVRLIEASFSEGTSDSSAPSSAGPFLALPFLIMEYIDGYSLLQLSRARRLTIIDTLDYAIQLLTGLDAVHRQGYLHRDLKPANIMIDRRRSLKIIDFGIAQRHRSGTGVQVIGPAGPLTTQGHIIGTMNYMAPELLRGEAASTATDLYSVGAIIWEMIHHHVPFNTRERNQLAQNVLYTNLEWSPAIGDFLPDGLIPLVSRMLAKTSDKRPTLTSALNELKTQLAELSLPAPFTRFCSTDKTNRRPVFDKKVLAENSIAEVEHPYLALARETLRQSQELASDRRVVAYYLDLKKVCAEARGVRIKRRLAENRGTGTRHAGTHADSWRTQLRTTILALTFGALAVAGIILLRYVDSSLLTGARLDGVPLQEIVSGRNLRAPAGQLMNTRLFYDTEVTTAKGEKHLGSETRLIHVALPDTVKWELRSEGAPTIEISVPVGVIPTAVFFEPLSGDRSRQARLVSYSTDFLKLMPGRKVTLFFKSALSRDVEKQVCSVDNGGKERLLQTEYSALEVKCLRSLLRGEVELLQSEESYVYIPDIGVILRASMILRERAESGTMLFKQKKSLALNAEKSVLLLQPN